MDYDADGDLDILSGSYTGEIYLFEGDGEGGFAQGRYLMNSAGGSLAAGTSITPEARDVDADGDLDLVIGTRTDGVFVVTNVGTRAEPSWAPKPVAQKTAGGEAIQGSNAHHADWDGDGLDDLIVGSEWGGASWHRNSGTNTKPVYGAAIELVGRREFEERDEEDGPSGPGSRTKVFVTDWNGDGRADLLLGDVQWLYETLPPLTPEQEARKTEIAPQYEAAEKAYYALVDERNAHVRAREAIPDELQARIDAASEVYSPLAKEMASFDRRKAITHGWVWLYLRAEQVAAVSSGPTTLEVKARPVEGSSDRMRVEATLRMDPGWHVYAELPEGSAYPLTEPTLTLSDGVELASNWHTASASKPSPNDVATRWYTQAVTFECEVVATDTMPDELEVGVYFQVCKDEMCLPPKTLSVSVPARATSTYHQLRNPGE